ncbi:MAG: hypothetical protein IJ475_02795 [Bacilli bacterium]|nr:hypothetical protein [Bacilli bacterium]
MNKKTSQKFAIFSLILCLFLIGVFTFGDSVLSLLKDKTVSVAERRITKVALETVDYGDWSYAIRWEEKTSAMFSFSSDLTSVVVTPDSNSNIAYTMNAQLDRISTGGTDLAAGELQIKLPLYISDVRDSSGYSISSTSSGVVARDVNDNKAFEIKMGDIPSSSSATSSDIFKYEVDIDSEIVIISNNIPIASDDLTSYSFSINYYVRPSDVNSGVKKVITTTLDVNGNSILSNEIDNTIKTRVTLANLYEQDVMIYEEWDEYWGEEPSTDLESYYYGVYYVDGTLDSNQPYELYMVPNAINGELVAYGNDEEFGIGDSESCVSDDYLLYSDYETLENYYCAVKTTLPNDDYLLRVFIVRYSSEYSEDEIGFELELSIVGESGSVVRTMGWGVGEDSTDEGSGEEETPVEPEEPTPPIEPETPEYPDAVYNELNSDVISDSAGIGAVNKIQNGKSLNFDFLIESGASSGNATAAGYVKAFNNWKLTELGTLTYSIDLGTDSMEIDSSYNTSTYPLELVSGDYVINSFYPENDNEYDYVLSTDKYLLELVSDITTYSSKDVYVKISGGDWKKIGTYQKISDGTITFTATTSDTNSVVGVSETNPVMLPNNVTDIKVTYEGARAAVYMGINLNVSLNSSTYVVDKISSLVDSDSEVVLKQKSNLVVNNGSAIQSNAATYLTKIDSGTYFESSLSATQDGSQNANLVYEATLYEQLNVSSSDYLEFSDLLNKQLSGSYNVLLPKGSVYVDSNVTTYDGTPALFAVSVTDNYQSTGRQLLTIDVTELSDNVKIDTNNVKSGFNFVINLTYSRESNNNYGNELVIDSVYVSGTELSEGYATSSSASSTLFSSNSVQNAFASLNDIDGNKKLMFSTDSLTVEKVSFTVGSYNTSVKSEIDTSYSTASEVLEGTNYTYRLEYIYSDNLEEISNVIFYDEFDSATGSGFRGYLSNVDVSYLQNTVGANPVVYYSTSKDIDFSDSTYKDLSNSTIWSNQKPSSLKDVTAIAVDTGDYVIKSSEGYEPMIDITLTAPNSYVDGSVISAINESLIAYTSSGTGKSELTSNTTSVSLNKSAINVGVTTKSSINGTDLGSGDLNNYVTILGSYGYLISVANNSEYTYKDIVVGDILPANISLDESNMKYYLDNNVDSLNSLGNDVTYSINDNNVSFNIDEISSNSIVNIWLPILIDVDNLGNGGDLINKAYISKIAGNAYNGTFVNSYNRVEIPSIDVNKYVMTQDSVLYTNTVGSVLIAKGEAYKYKIQIDNTSTVIANGIVAIDNVPDGLTVVDGSITNNGVYDSTNNTVTWNVDGLLAGNSVNLEYIVKVSDDITLGTSYTSVGHVTLNNPLSTGKYLYDSNTNIISTIYQIASDLSVGSLVSGPLADQQKEFNYAVKFEGDSSLNGSYDVIKNNEKIGSIVFTDGKASYTTKLVHGENILIKLLPGGVDYSISQIVEDGYEVSSNTGSISGTEYLITGTTSEQRLVSYEFINSYSVTTSVDLGVSVSYDKELLDGMFDVSLSKDDVVLETIANDTNGNMKFSTIDYKDIEGVINYKVKMNAGADKQISYDTMVYTISVILTNDGKGNLNSEIKYYDKYDKEVDSVVFKNSYVPIGLMIGSVNNSDYVDKNKSYNYSLTITGGTGSYDVLDTDGNIIDSISVDNTGSVTYDFSLKSDEKIIISDLSQGVSYYVKQDLVEYYTSTVLDMSYTLDIENNIISNSGVIGEDSIQVMFKNNYETVANFEPSVSVSLTDKSLEENEFTFVITDISEGSTSGYTEMVTNSVDGTVNFKNITYTRPGTYVYNIGQVKGASNHIYYDLSNCVLTLNLVDNGNGTMSVTSSYVYENDVPTFINKYSEAPIVPEVVNPNPGNTNTDTGTKNPNTVDKGFILVIVGVIVSILFVVVRRSKVQRFE